MRSATNRFILTAYNIGYHESLAAIRMPQGAQLSCKIFYGTWPAEYLMELGPPTCFWLMQYDARTSADDAATIVRTMPALPRHYYTMLLHDAANITTKLVATITTILPSRPPRPQRHHQNHGNDARTRAMGTPLGPQRQHQNHGIPSRTLAADKEWHFHKYCLLVLLKSLPISLFYVVPFQILIL